jgi:hypothetical protein
VQLVIRRGSVESRATTHARSDVVFKSFLANQH